MSPISIIAAVQRALQEEVKMISDEEAKLAGQRVEQRIKDKTKEIATLVVEKFDFNVCGTLLKVEVDFKNLSDLSKK